MDHQHGTSELRGKDFWEGHYAQAERVWSGKVNATLATVLSGFAPGRSLDLGCGEGGDVLWLAERGWDALGVDISETAISRASEEAARHPSLAGQARFEAADLLQWQAPGDFDLITLSFFHAPFEFQRERVLEMAKQHLAPGGRLVLLSHGSHPRSAAAGHDHANGQHDGPKVMTVDTELRSLVVPAEGFEVLQATSLTRQTTGPDGNPADIDDVLVVVRRSA